MVLSAACSAVIIGLCGAAGWHGWECTLFTLEIVAELGVGTQQLVFLHIQRPFGLFGWLLLELCACSTSENGTLTNLTPHNWDSQCQWRHLCMLLPSRWSWLPKFSFDWICHFPLICLFPLVSPGFLGAPASWYPKSGPADRWPVNSTVWGGCHWWAL